MNLRLYAMVLAAATAARAADAINGDIVYRPRVPPTGVGVSLGIGGGFGDFTSADASRAVRLGGNYEVRATFGTRWYVGAEVAYVGSRRDANPGGNAEMVRGGTPLIFSNGIEGVLRAQYPRVIGPWLLEPFAFGGIGHTHFGVDGPLLAASMLRAGDDVTVLPLGAGASASWNGFLLEARFTFRAIPGGNLIARSDGGAARLDNWAATGLIGYEF
ncbi:MAG TPA: hypothetical protein VLW85_14395 [Myxococcales bacterium]|nr:hypothetical protein [Myxococcales bacterium]